MRDNNFFSTLKSRLTRVSSLFFRAEGAVAARTNETVKAAVTTLKKTTEDIVTLLGENIPKDFAARFGQLEKKVKKDGRRLKNIETVLKAMSPRVKKLFESHFAPDEGTQLAELAESEDEEEDISEDENELDYTGKKDGLVTPPPPPPLNAAARTSTSLGISGMFGGTMETVGNAMTDS